MLASRHCGLLDALLTLDPKIFHGISSTFKNPNIVFLPNVPNEKSKYELSNSVEKGVLMGMGFPILNGF